jgi:hypothetical protein
MNFLLSLFTGGISSVYIYVAIALGGFGAGFYIEHLRFNDYIATQLSETVKKEHQSQLATDEIRKNKDAQINSINNQLVDAISELRKRSSRTDQSSNGQSGTGSALFAEDAEFLVREASRADTIRIALDACYKQYDAIK